MGTPSHAPPSIDRAVIPAAGYGTRLRPLTSVLPKEMLPLGRKFVLEHIVEEMRAAGITRLLFVISPDKGMIRRYFGSGEDWSVRCDYAIQPERKGLGDAILRGEAWTEGQRFVVAFGDCIIEKENLGVWECGSRGVEATRTLPGSPPSLPLQRLMGTHSRKGAAATVLTERVPREKTRQYGILAPAIALPDAPREPFPLADIVEKPAPEEAPSQMAVAARWALGPDIFDYLRRARPGTNGEIGLTEAVRALLADGKTGWAVPLWLGEARLDVGGWETYLVAAARAAAADPDFGPRVREAICGKSQRGNE